MTQFHKRSWVRLLSKASIIQYSESFVDKRLRSLDDISYHEQNIRQYHFIHPMIQLVKLEIDSSQREEAIEYVSKTLRTSEPFQNLTTYHPKVPFTLSVIYLKDFSKENGDVSLLEEGVKFHFLAKKWYQMVQRRQPEQDFDFEN